MGVIQPERYAQLEPLFIEALASHAGPGDRLEVQIRAVVAHLVEIRVRPVK